MNNKYTAKCALYRKYVNLEKVAKSQAKKNTFKRKAAKYKREALKLGPTCE